MLDMTNRPRLCTFQRFPPQSHTIYLSLVSVVLFETPLRKRMGVLDTHILKSMAGEDIFSNSVDSGGDKTYNANQICHMVEFLIGNIFVKFGGHLFRQVIGIPMGTNSLMTSLFLRK